MMSGACVGSFLVGVTASCVVAGCARGAQRNRSGLRCYSIVTVFCVSFIRLLLVEEGLVVVVAQSDV